MWWGGSAPVQAVSALTADARNVSQVSNNKILESEGETFNKSFNFQCLI